MFRKVLAVAVVALTGCAEAPVNEFYGESATRTTDTQDVNLYVDDQQYGKVALTGNTVFVESRDANNGMNETHKAALIKLLKDHATSWGFKVVNSAANAHSSLLYATDVVGPEVDGVTSTGVETVSTYSNGQTVIERRDLSKPLYRLTVYWNVQEYGKRWQTRFAINYKSWIPWDKNFEALKSSLIDQLVKVKFSPPTQNKKMAGPPGCIPRFGYEVEKQKDGNQFFDRVTQIHPNSPAQKVGLKVGDIVLAVDSKPYREWSKEEDQAVYEQRVPVPMKIERAGKIIRVQIRSEIMCVP